MPVTTNARNLEDHLRNTYPDAGAWLVDVVEDGTPPVLVVHLRSGATVPALDLHDLRRFGELLFGRRDPSATVGGSPLSRTP
jgi:hypothetical protein